MRRILKIAAAAALLVAAIGLGIFFFVAPAMVERSMNQVLVAPPYEATAAARRLHETLVVADMHADSLLWGRDLLERGERGHVDVPRLIEGNVAVQMFTLVSKTPSGLNIERNADDSDNVTWLAIGQRWPLRTWFSLKQRALYQAERLHAMAQASNGRFVIVKTKADLAVFLERRKTEPEIVAGILGIEGAQVLEGDPANVDAMFAAGYRMMAPTHFFDNEMAGSAHGIDKGGLTEAGRKMIARMEELGMIVDIAHGSQKQIDEVLAMATRPVVVSHGGVKGTCDNNRNLSDGQLRAIAANGGLVGIGYWDTAVCGTDPAAIARAQKYVIDLIGAEHVGLGSDYDGAVDVPFDTTGLPLLTEALLAEGLGEHDIARVMGGNQIRLLAELLPD
ncbi:peptidase M19 [Nitratireductor sp. CAU 1489]|uniref:Peptidase M19 n=1 Tax=Nitratireductor arenosus TaxID=2682096 RepID=A0A844QHB7_9HYPH|nr:membrane dipeptidase [Nitratireductor arenosus]MVA98547.1 peptidase M19 [Nitratireductor arenosus]